MDTPGLVAGFPTHVVKQGNGVRRALFVHCSLGHSGNWTGVQAELLDKLSMTAFDRPGHGKSGEWNGEGGADGLHALTTRIAAALIDKRADLIGHSYGATVALRLAMEQPEKVRSLTLIEPPLLSLAAGTPGYEKHEGAMAGFEEAVEAGDLATAGKIFHEAVNPDTPWESLPDRHRDRFTARVGGVMAERGVTVHDAAGLGVPGRIESVTQPVLLIEGSESPQVMRDVQTVLSARLPNVRRMVVIGAGHMAPITHPVNVAGEIAQFLKV